MATKRGRKPVYTPELHERIVNTLSSGVSIRDVCAYVGIDDSTYHRWVSIYPNFATDTTRARVQSRINAAGVIVRSAIGDPRKGIPGNPEDAKWYLERTDPMNWGRKDMLISLGIDPALLKQLKQKADAAGISLPDVFEAMVNELAGTYTATNSEE